MRSKQAGTKRAWTTRHFLSAVTLLALIIEAASGIANAQAKKPLLLRDPSVNKTQIAFSYAGSIWIANRDASNVRRLTTGGHEGKPIFSPDGTQIAFTGDYDGTHGVYVVAAAGGVPRRLTYHPEDYDVVGWTPDGKQILFSSGRAAFASGVVQLFTVPLEGGFATQVPWRELRKRRFLRTERASPMCRTSNGRRAWKRYRGGQTKPIWIANLADSSIEAKIPRDNSNDFNPMWVGDTIYFLSDRNGPVTLFAYDTKSQQVNASREERRFGHQVRLGRVRRHRLRAVWVAPLAGPKVRERSRIGHPDHRRPCRSPAALPED